MSTTEPTSADKKKIKADKSAKPAKEKDSKTKKKDAKEKDVKDSKDIKKKDSLVKENFPYMKVSQFGMKGYKEESVRIKRQDEKWRDCYCCLFLEYILIYPVPEKGAKPLAIAEPDDHVLLDEFHYKVVDRIESRTISGGLIPRKEKYENTMILGVAESEMLIEFPNESLLSEWIPIVRAQVKACLKFKKLYGNTNVEETIQSIIDSTPKDQPFMAGPSEGKEELFIEQMAFGHSSRKANSGLFKKAINYSQYYTMKNKPYFDWFIGGGGSGERSFEKDLLDTEDKYITGPTGWKGLFLNFTEIEKSMRRIGQIRNPEKEKLLAFCELRVNQIEWFNKYMNTVYQAQPQYLTEQKKWKSAISTIQQWIDKEIADIEAEEKRLEEERKTEIERQMALQREAQRQQEIALANPLSDVNIYVTVDDPFADVFVENVLNDYGEVANFGLSPPPYRRK